MDLLLNINFFRKHFFNTVIGGIIYLKNFIEGVYRNIRLFIFYYEDYYGRK